MATVKLSRHLQGEILRAVQEPFRTRIRAEQPKLAALAVPLGDAFYETRMPKDKISAWESLPPGWRHLDLRGQVTVNLGNTRYDRHVIEFTLTKPMPSNIARTTQATSYTYHEFKKTWPELHAIAAPVLDEINKFITEEQALVAEVQKAMNSCVTLNRLLKAVPAFQRYVPPYAMEQMNRARGPSQIDKEWTPDTLQTGLLRGNVLTTA